MVFVEKKREDSTDTLRQAVSLPLALRRNGIATHAAWGCSMIFHFQPTAARVADLSISGSLLLPAHLARCTPAGANHNLPKLSRGRVPSSFMTRCCVGSGGVVMATAILADAANFASPASAAEHGQWLCSLLADQ